MNSSVAYTLALCTHNHAERLAKTLTGLKRLLPPSASWEILVINNASTDATASVLEQKDWRPQGIPVRIVVESKLGIANARNRAMLVAAGEYVLFIDDDETPDENWLVEYERAIQADHPDALGGKIDILFEGAERPSWLQDELRGFIGALSYGTETRYLTEPSTPTFTGNSGFRKTAVMQIGGFDSSLGRRGHVNSGGEDTDLYRRLIAAGMRVRWVEEAVIYHRIEAPKLHKSYFLDLHYRQGRMEGSRKREGGRVPPLYLFGHFARALNRALVCRFSRGADFSLRLEMNAAYFLGFIHGWVFGQS
jgi:glycosyltransferase involved in cell wall biosynthesis